MAPQPPRSGVASPKERTCGERASVFLTISRCTPMPRPWTRRTSEKPFAAASATYSSTTEAVSEGRKGWRSSASSIGIATASSSSAATELILESPRVPALLTLCPKNAPSRTVVLREGESPIAGRDADCEVPLHDVRASTRHARFDFSEKVWRLVDLGSKNGTFVNGLRITESPLTDEDWVSFGGLPARFSLATESDLEAFRSERRALLKRSSEMALAIESETDARALLTRLIESALAVVRAERGFVLVQSTDGVLHAEAEVGAAHGLRLGFRGSVGAVERVLETGRTVVSADARSEEFLGKRPSVVELGLRALACVPLEEGGRVFGVLYLDGKKEAPAFSGLDVEILETLAERAAILLAGARLHVELRVLAGEAASAELAG